MPEPAPAISRIRKRVRLRGDDKFPNGLGYALAAALLLIGSFCIVISLMNVLGDKDFHEYVTDQGSLSLTVPLALACTSASFILAYPIPVGERLHDKHEVRNRRKTRKALKKNNNKIANELKWREDAFCEIWRDSDKTADFTSSVLRLIWKFDTFSMGLSDVSYIELAPAPESVSDKESFAQYRKRVEARKREMDDISRIWASKTALGGFSIANTVYLRSDNDTKEQVAALGRALGVDIMLESYYEGVPVEYIVESD